MRESASRPPAASPLQMSQAISLFHVGVPIDRGGICNSFYCCHGRYSGSKDQDSSRDDRGDSRMRSSVLVEKHDAWISAYGTRGVGWLRSLCTTFHGRVETWMSAVLSCRMEVKDGQEKSVSSYGPPTPVSPA